MTRFLVTYEVAGKVCHHRVVADEMSADTEGRVLVFRREVDEVAGRFVQPVFMIPLSRVVWVRLDEDTVDGER